jgi:hypothetical protein
MLRKPRYNQDCIGVPSGAEQLGSAGVEPPGAESRVARSIAIAGVLVSTVPHSLERSAQPRELGLVGFGNAVDVGGDLDTCCPG